MSPQRALVTIGLDAPVVARLRTKLDRPVRAYAAPPRIEVRDGVTLAMATRVDNVEEPRSVLRAADSLEASATSVAKWGHRHCGEGKALVRDRFAAEELTLVEPFVEGASVRILLVGDVHWQLRYESDDWRKNVRATVTVVDLADPRLVERARRIADGLALPMVGVDFVVRGGDAMLLEINAYPGLDDAPGAIDAFVDSVAGWAEKLDAPP